MLSRNRNIRVWNVTVTWKTHVQTLQKEFIITAPDKATAEQLANNRLPNHLLSQSDKNGQIRSRDLGIIQNEKTYFSSDPFVSNNARQNDAPQYERVLLYAQLWGAELGWRKTNQVATEQDDIYLKQMEKEPNLIAMLNDWATQSLYSINQDPEDFFTTKMSEYLGTKVVNIKDMIPVSDRNYEKLQKTAELEAQKIIYDARQEANRIKAEANDIKREAQRDKTLVAQILQALQQGTIPPAQPIKTPEMNEQPEDKQNEHEAPLLDKCQVDENDEPQQTETSETKEETIESPITTQNEPIFNPEEEIINENEEWKPITDQDEPTFNPLTDTHTDFNNEIDESEETNEENEPTEGFTPMPMANIPDNTDNSIEEELEQAIDEPEDDDITDETQISDKTPTEPEPEIEQKPVPTPTPPHKNTLSPLMRSSDLSHDAITQIIRGWKLDQLQSMLPYLTIKIRKDHKIKETKASEVWSDWLQIQECEQNKKIKNKKEQLEYMIRFIQSCQFVNDIPPLVFVYYKYTGQELKLYQEHSIID